VRISQLVLQTKEHHYYYYYYYYYVNCLGKFRVNANSCLQDRYSIYFRFPNLIRMPVLGRFNLSLD